MIIDVLVCSADGTQLIETREVPDELLKEPDLPVKSATAK